MAGIPPARDQAGERLPMWLWAALALVLPLLLLAGRLLQPEATRLHFLARVLFWCQPVLLVLLAAALRQVGQLPRADMPPRPWWPSLLVAGALTALAVVVAPPALRVQFDETSLASTAQGMAAQHAALRTTAALPFDAAPVPVEQTVDKRPPLFPFVVAVAHWGTGERAANGPWTNTALLFVALLLLHRAAQRALGAAGGLAAPLLLLAVPLVPVVGTSGGFEPLAALLLGLLLAAAQAQARDPQPARTALVVALLLLFAHCRYESLLVGALVAGPALWRARGRGRDPVLLAGLVLAPGLLLPLLWLLQHAQNPNFYPEAAGQPLLALGHLATNLPPFLAAWFAPQPAAPLPGPLAWLGAAAALAFVWRRGAGAAGRGAALAVGLPVLAATAVVWAWFYGDVRESTALRLYLPAAVATSLLPLLGFALLGPRGRWALLAVVAALAAVRLTATARGEALPAPQTTAMLAALDRATAAAGGGTGRTLWVGVPAQHWLVHGKAALPPEAFWRRRSEVEALRRQGQIDAVFVVTTPLDAAFAPAFGDPAELLRQLPHERVFQSQGGPAIGVYRLR